MFTIKILFCSILGFRAGFPLQPIVELIVTIMVVVTASPRVLRLNLPPDSSMIKVDTPIQP